VEGWIGALKLAHVLFPQEVKFLPIALYFQVALIFTCCAVSGDDLSGKEVSSGCLFLTFECFRGEENTKG
jgi:hypothetical protein